MSTAEPFMPAHEPAPPLPGTEHDIDGDVDVLFDDVDPDQGELEIDHDAPAPPFHPPVPGDRLTAEQLESDLASAPDKDR